VTAASEIATTTPDPRAPRALVAVAVEDSVVTVERDIEKEGVDIPLEAGVVTECEVSTEDTDEIVVEDEDSVTKEAKSRAKNW
jgi:hypothetical protein